MKRLIVTLFVFALSHAALASEASIQGKHFSDRTNGIYDTSIKDSEVSAFLDAMKATLANNDIKAFAKLISYPCRWNKTKTTLMLKNEAAFLKHQKAILTPAVKNLILNAKLDDLFVNSQGFMLGNGEIWFDPRKGILAFNQME
jgi:hypothetical protein